MIFYLVFLGLFFGVSYVGDPETLDYNIQTIILNYVFWFLILTITQGIGWEISNEAGQGTLEQLYLTPHKLWFILFSRMISTILLNMITIAVLLTAAMLTTGRWLNLDLVSIFPILMITLVGVFGVGYAVAGITLVLKQVDYILQLFQFLVMGLTFIPLTAFPLLKFGPFMLGLQMIRDISIEGYTITTISMADMIFLVLNSFIYFIVGFLIFQYCEIVARKKGLFGHY